MAVRHLDEPIEPIRKSRVVPLSPERAFELYTAGLDRWWPLATHSIAQRADLTVRFEGIVGGRVVEVRPDGTECSWADVIAWDPPHRLVLAWHPDPEPVAASIIEIRFLPADNGHTELRIVHRGWEEHGTEAHEYRSSYDSGWDEVLGHYLATADAGASADTGAAAGTAATAG